MHGTKQYAEQLVAEARPITASAPRSVWKPHAEQRAHGEMTHYDGCCRDLPREEVEKRLAAGEPYVIRPEDPAKVIGSDDMVYGHIEVNSEMDDQILIKTDGMPTLPTQMSWTTTSWASPTASSMAARPSSTLKW